MPLGSTIRTSLAVGSVYAMDNHRAAMWCWLRQLIRASHILFHMDRHYDCLRMDEWLENCPEDIRRRASMNILASIMHITTLDVNGGCSF